MSVKFNRMHQSQIKLQDFSAYFWNTPRKCSECDVGCRCGHHVVVKLFCYVLLSFLFMLSTACFLLCFFIFYSTSHVLAANNFCVKYILNSSNARKCEIKFSLQVHSKFL